MKEIKHCHSRGGGNPYSRVLKVIQRISKPVVMDSFLRGNDNKVLLPIIFLILCFSPSAFSATPAPAGKLLGTPNIDDKLDVDLDTIPMQEEKTERTAEEIKYDKDSDDCYNRAQEKLKVTGKPAANIAAGSPDPKAEALDRFYSECMKKKGYNLEQNSLEGEVEE